PVHLSTINNQVNFEYFRYNYLTDLGPRYDGLTTDFNSVEKKTLTASAQVEQCSTYRIKIAIGDTDTGFFGGGDSGIFFGDLNVGLPDAVLTASTSFDNLVEGCTGNDNLDLNLSNPLGEELTLEVQISGTATQGTDYTLNIPNSVTFPAGQTNLNFPISIINDGITEGTENIEINFVYDFGCGEFDFATTVISIEDAPNFSAANGADTVFVCAGSSIQLNAEGAQTYSWSPAATLDDPNSATPTATTATSQLYTVMGTLGSCNLMDEVFVEVIDPMVTVSASDVTICEGTSVTLTANNNVGNMGISWSPIIGLDDPNAPNPTATPPQTITYTATVSIAGCSVSDQVIVTVDPFEFPVLTTTDTVLCQGDSLTLASATPGSQTDYAWSPSTDILNPDESDAIAFPASNTTYTLTATSPNNFCTETATVAIEVVPASLEIQGGNFYELCLGETVDLTAITSTNGVGLTWTPDSSLTSGTATTVTASPDLTTDYIAELVVGGCTLQEVITVKVDSLPVTVIEVIPPKDSYCKDEIVSFISPSIDVGFFPDIEFMWTPNDGSLLSDPDNLNLAVVATTTQTYTRTITNGGCSNTESITIEVIDVNVELNTSDVALCLDETIDLEATGATNYAWDAPGNGLSCDDCPNPTLTAMNPGTITVFGETEGCEDSESINIALSDSPTSCAGFSNQDTVSVGESVQLSVEYDSNSPVTVDWTTGGSSIGQGDSIMVAVNAAGDNIFTYTVTNSDGCSCSNEIIVLAVKPLLKMPNAFTPDGDDVNDFFDLLFTAEGTDVVVDRGEVEVVQFKIFNRWGNVVYENETPDLGWDGTIDGKAAPSEVYVYFVEIRYPDGTTDSANGDVTLIR
ncbi:MAG: gliding motility-associated C-terminal domain-containing protein, partial [Bacteroidota bacterium]